MVEVEVLPDPKPEPLMLPAPPRDKLEVYRERMFKPTSKTDIQHMLGKSINIVDYNTLSTYNDIEDLLGPNRAFVILYPNPGTINETAFVGHWTCCFVRPNTEELQYYDSYGCVPDKNVHNFNNEDEKVAAGLMRPINTHLLDLMLKSKYAHNTRFSEYPMQAMSLMSPSGEFKQPATCGLWVAMRLKNNNLDENEFYREWYEAPRAQGIVPDLIVAAMTCSMYPEMC